MAETKKLRVALYIRTSTKDQNPEMQVRSLREWATENHGWEIVAEFQDQLSGRTTQRPAFQEMLKAATKRGKKSFDVVAFWSLDRFGRSGVVETLIDLSRIAKAGVRYISKEEAELVDSTKENPFSEPLIALIAKFAEMERNRIRSRIKAGLANRKAKGLALGRARVIFDREKALAMRKDGHSVREIAATLKVSRSVVHRETSAR